MGMSISYQIITEKHGGELTFSSEVGQGTAFVIYYSDSSGSSNLAISSQRMF